MSGVVKSKRGFSTPQADTFAGANVKKKRRLASVEMTAKLSRVSQEST
jgi:hypothetical protein